MTVSIYYIIIFAVAFTASFWATPIVIKLAYKANVVDIPKDNRRMHKKTMARMGGVAIIIGIYVALTLYTILSRFEPKLIVDNRLIGFAIGGMMIAIMGLLDDVRGIKPIIKLLIQIAAASVIFAFGARIEEFKIPFINSGELINLGILSYPITVLWIVGITNAINLIDGLDGLAAGISAISATSMLFVFLMSPLSVEAIIITIALVGAILGFLPFNFNPAKTFMGDVRLEFSGLYSRHSIFTRIC